AADLGGGGEQRGDVSGAAAPGEQDAGRALGGHRVLRDGEEEARRFRRRERFRPPERGPGVARFAGRERFAPDGAASRGAGSTLMERRTDPRRALIASGAPGSRRAKEI